ncbi:MAG TPA: hypothetical protein VNX21_05955, partial [Candidatus Thermoplasmatota archaeon]|nr:hypothetical protein [Candidatus Thermoplasmatota archaeon]
GFFPARPLRGPMRRAILPATLLAALLLPTALAGPVGGVVRQDETQTHAFDNRPRDGLCPEVMTTWTVTLAYAPATDVLTLSAGGRTVEGHDGLARVSFPAGVCTSFTIEVTGTRVTAAAAYTLHTMSMHGGDVIAWD